MVRINDMDEFEERVLGLGVDLEPRTVKGENGAFMIQLTGNLLETTAYRIKRTIDKYTGEQTTPVYLSLDDNVVSLGSVDITMSFYKELNSLLTPYKPEFFNYVSGERIPYDVSVLIPTIKIVRTYDAEKFI